MFELGTKLNVCLNKDQGFISTTITIYDDKLEHYRDLKPDEKEFLAATTSNEWEQTSFRQHELIVSYRLNYIGTTGTAGTTGTKTL